MASLDEIYVKWDELDVLPKPNRDNWLFELEFLQSKLARSARVLQVGSMDGTRMLRLLDARPDLQLTGLEIEAPFVEAAKKKFAEVNIQATFILGDITDPPVLPQFDYVICLNNTLGYIPQNQKAIEEMKKLGKTIIISVYGERFDNELAREYFESVTLKLERVEGNRFILEDSSIVKRYTRQEVESWTDEITETPLGYLCTLKTP